MDSNDTPGEAIPHGWRIGLSIAMGVFAFMPWYVMDYARENIPVEYAIGLGVFGFLFVYSALWAGARKRRKANGA